MKLIAFTLAHAGTLLWICERIRQRRRHGRHAALVARLWAPTSTGARGVLILVQRLHCQRCGQRCADQRFVRKGLREGSEHDDDVESDSVPLVPSTDDEPAAANRQGDDVASLCVSCAAKAKVDSPHWERSTFRIVRRRIRGATVHDTFARAFQLYATERCLGTRTRSSDDEALSKSYCWLTYADVQRWATHFGSGLRHLGVAPTTLLWRTRRRSMTTRR